MDKRKFTLSGIVIVLMVILTVAPSNLQGSKTGTCKYPCQCNNAPGWTGTCTIDKPIALKGVCWWVSKHTCVDGCQVSVVNQPCPEK